MPIYVYRRRDGSSFELEERITMDSLVHSGKSRPTD